MAISSSCQGRMAWVCWTPGRCLSQQGGLMAEDTHDPGGGGLSGFRIAFRKKATSLPRVTWLPRGCELRRAGHTQGG